MVSVAVLKFFLRHLDARPIIKVPFARRSTIWCPMTHVNETYSTPDCDRPIKPALLRGWRLKCPSCGSGPLMRTYLKTHDQCVVCGEEIHHHRADDGPAYMTILVAGHLLAPMIMFVYSTFRPDPLIMAIFFCILFTALALFLLPRFKGVFVAIQWAKRMHGFGRQDAP